MFVRLAPGLLDNKKLTLVDDHEVGLPVLVHLADAAQEEPNAGVLISDDADELSSGRSDRHFRKLASTWSRSQPFKGLVTGTQNLTDEIFCIDHVMWRIEPF